MSQGEENLGVKSVPTRLGQNEDGKGATRATIREVAKRAAVSLTTVSRVINSAKRSGRRYGRASSMR